MILFHDRKSGEIIQNHFFIYLYCLDYPILLFSLDEKILY